MVGNNAIQVVVATFRDETGADKALGEVQAIAWQGLIMVDNAAALRRDQGGIARLEPLHAEAHERLYQLLQPDRVVGADLEARVGGVDRGAADLELLDLVAAPGLEDLVEDAGEQHRVDDVAVDLQGLGVGEHGSSSQVAGRR